MGLPGRKKPKSRKKWLAPIAMLGAAAAALGLKKRRSKSTAEATDAP